MNIVSLAQKNNIALFKEFLDLDCYEHNPEDYDIIFKSRSLPIQQAFYDKYNTTNIRVVYSALLYSKLDVSVHTLDNAHMTEYLTDMRILETGKIKLDTSILPFIKNENLIRALEPSMISGPIIQIAICDTIHYRDLNKLHKRLLKLNPLMGQFMRHSFESTTIKYDYELLVLCIKHCNIIFPTSIYVNVNLCKIIDNVRQNGLPEWTLPRDVELVHLVMTLDELDYCVRMDIPPSSDVRIHTVNDVDLIIKHIKYIDKFDIFNMYMMRKHEFLLEYILDMDPIFPITIDLKNEGIEYIHKLGERYWKAMAIGLNSSIITMNDVQLTMLRDIGKHCTYTWEEEHTFHDLILLYQYLDGFVCNNKLRPYPTYMNSMININKYIVDYKEGLNKLWKIHHEDPICVMLALQYVPHILPMLDPPIPKKYYKFLDEKTIKRINGIDNISAFSDISITL